MSGKCLIYGLLNDSASELYKLVLKDCPYIQKLSCTNLFPKSCYQYISTFKKPCHELCQQPLKVRKPLVVLVTTHGNQQPLMVRNHLWFATTCGSHIYMYI